MEDVWRRKNTPLEVFGLLVWIAPRPLARPDQTRPQARRTGGAQADFSTTAVLVHRRCRHALAAAVAAALAAGREPASSKGRGRRLASSTPGWWLQKCIERPPGQVTGWMVAQALDEYGS